MKRYDLAIVLNCIDGRVQLPVQEYLSVQAERILVITWPGVDRLFLGDSNDEYALKCLHLELSKAFEQQTNGRCLVVIVGHEQCAGNNVNRATHLANITESVERVRTWIQHNNHQADVVGLLVNHDWQVERVEEARSEANENYSLLSAFGTFGTMFAGSGGAIQLLAANYLKKEAHPLIQGCAKLDHVDTIAGELVLSYLLSEEPLQGSILITPAAISRKGHGSVVMVAVGSERYDAPLGHPITPQEVKKAGKALHDWVKVGSPSDVKAVLGLFIDRNDVITHIK